MAGAWSDPVRCRIAAILRGQDSAVFWPNVAAGYFPRQNIGEVAASRSPIGLNQQEIVDQTLPRRYGGCGGGRSGRCARNIPHVPARRDVID